MKLANKEKQAAHNVEVSRLRRQLDDAKDSLLKELGDYSLVFSHVVYKDAQQLFSEKYNSCPECYSTNSEVVNYDAMWRDGDVVCKDCGTYDRGYDAG